MNKRSEKTFLIRFLRDADMYIGGILFGILVTLTFINVLMRYIFRMPISWSEEMSLILFAWSTYLGIATCLRYDKHMRVSFIFDLLPKPIQKFLDIANDIVLLILFGYLSYLSVVLCSYATVKRTLVMRLPANVVNATLIACFGIMTVSCAFKVVNKLRGTYSVENPLADVEELAREMDNM